jgi:serine protease Do
MRLRLCLTLVVLAGVGMLTGATDAESRTHYAGSSLVPREPGGGGEAAGLQAGDVIAAIAGKPVRDLHQFHEVLSRHHVGEAIRISVWREGQTLTLEPVLKEES